MYATRFVIPEILSPLTCGNCAGKYLPDANVGRWACRVHRLLPVARVYPCCGLRLDHLNDRAPERLGPSPGVELAQGCYACDHDVSFETPPDERIFFLMAATYAREEEEIMSRAVLRRAEGYAAVATRLSGMLPAGIPRAAAADALGQIMREYVRKNLSDVEFFRVVLAFHAPSGALAELQRRFTMLCRLVVQTTDTEDGATIEWQHLRQTILSHMSIVAENGSSPWADLSEVWDLLTGYLGASPLTMREYAAESERIIDVCIDEREHLNIWFLYEISRLDEGQDLGVVAKASFQNYLLSSSSGTRHYREVL